MNINCDVVRDLLIQYADETLGETSEKIVKEHLAECEDCRSYYEEIKGIYAKLDKSADNSSKDIGALKSIKRSIARKRIVAAFSSVIVIVLLFIAGSVCANSHYSYIPYESSGITCSNNEIRTTNNYAQLIAVDVEYQGENLEFMFLCSSPASRHSSLKGVTTIIDMSQRAGSFKDDEGNTTTTYVDRVYYLPETAINKLPFIYNVHYLPIDLIDMDHNEIIPQLIEQSALVWSRD